MAQQPPIPLLPDTIPTKIPQWTAASPLLIQLLLKANLPALLLRNMKSPRPFLKD